MSSVGPTSVTLHAGCVLLGEAGVLIRGRSGIGKSTLARALVEAVDLRGGYAAHVADDRTIVSAENGRLVARPHPILGGRIEVRGLGIGRMTRHAPAAVLRLVVDLLDEPPPRWPEADDLRAEVLGLSLPRLPACPDEAGALVLERTIRGSDDTLVNGR